MRETVLERYQGAVPAWGGTPADGSKTLCLFSAMRVIWKVLCGDDFGWFVLLLLLAEKQYGEFNSSID